MPCRDEPVDRNVASASPRMIAAMMSLVTS
jgi:hypothetical protein